MEDLYSIFHRHFEILQADSKALLDKVFHLRYQVYCVENQFEKSSHFPDNREMDIYDTRSLHSLIKHNDSNLSAGAVRLILPDPVSPQVEFPIESACKQFFDQTILKSQVFPRETMGEISRFASSKKFKKQITQECVDCKPTSEGQQDRVCHSLLLPHIPIGLFAACVEMAAKAGITHWYAVMEATFIRFLARFGIEFQALGPAVEYHGKRVPCYGEIDAILSDIYRKRPDVWEIITDQGRVWPLNGYVTRGLRATVSC